MAATAGSLTEVRTLAQDLFPLVAQTRDYCGPGRPIRGDQRYQVQRTAVLLARDVDINKRVRMMIRSIETYRAMAKDGLVPHPGQIPNGVRELRDVPGWENAEYPNDETWRVYSRHVSSARVLRLPHRSETVQIDRDMDKKERVLPSEYDAGEDIARPLLMLFVSLGQQLMETDEWTDKDFEVWRNEVVPMLTDMLDSIPTEAWSTHDGNHEEG